MASRQTSIKFRPKIDRPQAQKISELYDRLGLKTATPTTMKAFKNTLHNYRKSYETSEGEAGTSFRIWESSQVELSRMAEGFLTAHGAEYWSEDREWYVKGDPIHPKHNGKLLQSLKELFFMQNQNQKTNKRPGGVFEVPAAPEIAEDLLVHSGKGLPGFDSSGTNLHINSVHDTPMSPAIPPKRFVDVFDGPDSEDEIPSIPGIAVPEHLTTHQISTKRQNSKPSLLDDRSPKRNKRISSEDYSPRRTGRSPKPTKRPGFVSTLGLEVTNELDQETEGSLLASIEEEAGATYPCSEVQPNELVSSLAADSSIENSQRQRHPSNHSPQAPTTINPPASLAWRVSIKNADTARNISRRSVNFGIRPFAQQMPQTSESEGANCAIGNQVQNARSKSPVATLDTNSTTKKDFPATTKAALTLQKLEGDASTRDKNQRSPANSHSQPVDLLDDPTNGSDTTETAIGRLKEAEINNMTFKAPIQSMGLPTELEVRDKQPDVPSYDPASDSHLPLRCAMELTTNTATRQLDTPNPSPEVEKRSPERSIKLTGSPTLSPQLRTATQINMWVITRSPKYTEHLCSLKIQGTSLNNFTSAISRITGSGRTIGEIKIKLVAPSGDAVMSVRRGGENRWIITRQALAYQIKLALAEAKREERPAALQILIEPLYDEGLPVDGLPDEDENMDIWD